MVQAVFHLLAWMRVVPEPDDPEIMLRAVVIERDPRAEGQVDRGLLADPLEEDAQLYRMVRRVGRKSFRAHFQGPVARLDGLGELPGDPVVVVDLPLAAPERVHDND